ncbi:hypothetical protein BAY61_29365 [Prauserella marina]|uniref:Uncharacterized protein n=1 Tax=Prauserella marina TaxID=530584 RepID=A0A222VXL0_9PSEU|nr:DUF418 domain-containing protein [Prauserella marina]ASR38431.1 hypothetical protein BAY61_29365 [Prauserella marina]PWV78332.1 uncharacterized protein DES30_10462 [Prauserella marina]SDC83621.1 uncharacterized protein SAMN05421630_10462 [Prauserella marina]
MAAHGRIAALDIIRGVAILGTLGTNIWIFTDPLGAAGFFALPEPDSFDGFTETALRFLSNGKFLALLSLLFGIGLELQYRSAIRKGKRWPGWYLWRSALLLVEGLLHYVLIFEFDVLMYYAVVSVLVAFLVARGDRVRKAWLIAAGALHLAFVSLVTAGMYIDGATIATGSGGAGTGSWLAQVQHRLTDMGMYRAEAVFVIPLSTVLFLAGIGLLRAGAIENSGRGTAIQRKLIGIGIGIGLPLNVSTSFAGPELFFVDRYVAAPIVAFGLLGLVPWVVHRMREQEGPLRRGMASVGRMALSCYVLQNLIAGILCYGWGFGLAETMADARPWWVVGCFTGISVLLLALSSLWLRRFSRGPLEAAWQWAYLAPQGQSAVAATPH